MLNSEKAKLGVDHARLKGEFDLLDKAHKVLKGAHASLKESHDQLQVKLTKEKAAFLIWSYLIMQMLLTRVVIMCIWWRRMPS